jgi:hypothetical protein
MFDATVGKPRKADINKIVNEIWIVFQVDIDFGDICKIWDIVLQGNGIYIPALEGWNQEALMPEFKHDNFEYECELHWLDDSTYYVFQDVLNMKLTEYQFKDKLRNWFAWNSISQS